MSANLEGSQIGNIFETWERGAQELEKTGLGKVITAPIRIPGAIATSTIETVKQLPNVAKAIPVILIILAIGAGTYLVLRGKSEKGGLI